MALTFVNLRGLRTLAASNGETHKVGEGAASKKEGCSRGEQDVGSEEEVHKACSEKVAGESREDKGDNGDDERESREEEGESGED
jgi:hypothetical protein